MVDPADDPPRRWPACSTDPSSRPPRSPDSRSSCRVTTSSSSRGDGASTVYDETAGLTREPGSPDSVSSHRRGGRRAGWVAETDWFERSAVPAATASFRLVAEQPSGKQTGARVRSEEAGVRAADWVGLKARARTVCGLVDPALGFSQARMRDQDGRQRRRCTHMAATAIPRSSTNWYLRALLPAATAGSRLGTYRGSGNPAVARVRSEVEGVGPVE